jgi:sugar-phosphatase
MVRCDAILFDLDGVLVDSIVVVERHWTQWALKHGFDPDEILQNMHGKRTIETVRVFAPHLDVVHEAELISKGETYDTEGMKVIDGAKELIQSLPESCWTIATSGTRETALNRIRFAGIPVPANLVTADDVEKGKPNPDPYLLAAKKLGKNPERCVVIEDAPAGVTAGKAAGAFVIAVTTSHDESELQHADMIIDRLANIAVQIIPSDAGNALLEITVKQPMLSV